MSYADQVFRANCLDILQNGVRDDDLTVRPHWEDGTPAHTIKKFGLVNRYDLQREFPILTLRRTYWKSAVDELLWIWQKKSNNVHDLSSHIWDAWADETGSIGKAYGYQLGVKHQYKEGMFDQVDRVLYDLRHNPASRRILTSLYNFEDLHDMNLYPCAYSMTFNVSNGTLNAILNQRSQDMLAANNWNVSVRGARPHVCPGLRPQSRRARPRHCRRAHLRPPHPHHRKDALRAGAPRPAVHSRSRRDGFLRLHSRQRPAGKLSVQSL